MRVWPGARPLVTTIACCALACTGYRPPQSGRNLERTRHTRPFRQSAGGEAIVPRTPMTSDEATRLLEDGQLVRVAFRHGDAPYLIPLGYTWLGSALYGVADRGLKTELAERNPTVAFQVDTALDTGLFAWESVTGTGCFAVVTDGDEASRALAALQPFVAEAPAWWRAEQGPRMAAGALIVWRIEPDSFTGVRYAPRETP
jgi:nitroimidazol reductase NimA-like FMN-containing flavoprotein (pyridoxamine 5'-phosphate oxidase superfamily)